MPNSGQKLISITYSEKGMGMKTNVYRVLTRKPEGKRPLERPRCRWQDNIKISLKELGWDGMV